MVLLGLVLGVIVAVAVAAQGCGSNHPNRRTFHGSVDGGAVASASAASPSSGNGAARGDHPAARAKRPTVAHRVAHSVARRPDPAGPFVGFAAGRIARSDPPRAGRAVALTFDDGPGPQTIAIVDELRRLHARATFFVVGSMAAARPSVVQATVRAGMQIANHTWSHPAMPPLSLSAQRLQIDSTNSILRHITGRRPRFFRPPNWRIGSRTAGVVHAEHMVAVLRTVDTRDWTLPGTRTIVRKALRVKPGGIVAMHDAGGYTRAQTVAAVPAIVRGLRRRHLRLVTIDELYSGAR
jgi:peptidoglycan/xylan/chitin deacetylase (PgdA/CDA1 family)